MDLTQFAAITRAWGARPSRRHVLRGLTGGFGSLAGATFAVRNSDARKKRRKNKKRKKPQPSTASCTPSCTGKVCGDDGCGGSCGSCPGELICQAGGSACGCPAEKEALSNDSCAIVCAANNECPNFPASNGCSNPSTEGAKHCIVGSFNPDVFCTTTADCPVGSHCQDIGVKVCIKLTV